MTRKEMLKRFRELGGKTKRNALIITIEKWVGLIEFWPKEDMHPSISIGDNVDNYPATENCGLCEIDGDNCCEKCPLFIAGDDSFSCCDAYDLFERSIKCNERADYLKGRRQIITKCRKALKEMEA